LNFAHSPVIFGTMDSSSKESDKTTPSSQWMTGEDLIARWGIMGFELFEYMKQGLQAYTRYGKKIVDSDPLEKAPRYTLDFFVDSLKAAEKAGRVLSGKMRPPRSDREINKEAKKAFESQTLEVINPPRDCVLMSFTLPNNEKLAEEAISKAKSFFFKLKDVSSFEQEEKNKSPQYQPQITTEQKKPTEKKTQEPKLFDSEKFVRSLRISYLNDTEIRIGEMGKKAKTYGKKELGFIKENSKTWDAFINILKVPDHRYYVGTAHGANKTRKHSYDVSQKTLSEISNKLVSFLSETYRIQLPDKFKLFERAIDDKPGTYQLKVQVSGSKEKTKDQFETMPENELLAAIADLSAQFKKISKFGDEEAEEKGQKISAQLYSAVEIAGKKGWLTPNRARYYLSPEEPSEP
jgi:hypothetical protein